MVEIIRRTSRDRILWIALGCALASLVVGRPTADALNWQTLLSLFALMVTVQLLQAFRVLDYLSHQLLRLAQNQRRTAQFFTALAFVGAMFVTNDVAILTLMPMIVLVARQQSMRLPLVATLVTLAANLGSAFTPFGNPQNLFLIARYRVGLGTFFQWSLPLMVTSGLLLAGLTLLVPAKAVPVFHGTPVPVQPAAVLVVTGLLGLVLLGVFHVLPILWVAGITLVVGLIVHRSAVAHVDYGLLLTFVCFFVFVSDIRQSPAVIHLMATVTRTPVTVYLTGILTSQVISNVPATVLLARFTTSAQALFWGVNVGGLGTLVASLANLLALKQLLALGQRAHLKAFVRTFTALNLLGLLVLGLVGLIICW